MNRGKKQVLSLGAYLNEKFRQNCPSHLFLFRRFLRPFFADFLFRRFGRVAVDFLADERFFPLPKTRLGTNRDLLQIFIEIIPIKKS